MVGRFGGGGGSSATLGQYKLFTLHPVCDIIREAWREERMVGGGGGGACSMHAR